MSEHQNILQIDTDAELQKIIRQLDSIPDQLKAPSVLASALNATANEMKRTHLVVNRLRMDMVKRGDMMSAADVVDILAISLIGIVPDDENVVVATNQGEPLVGNNTLAGKAYQNICYRVTGKEIPFLEFEKGVSFWTRVSGIFHKN